MDSLDRMIRGIGRAIKDDRATGLAYALARLHEDGAFEDPGLFAPPLAERYARRLIWEDPDGRFVVVGMSWGPDQSSPLHDHDGLWGSEIVVAGTMLETTYRARERDAGGRMRLAPERERELRDGDVGVLVPPFEYHACANVGTTVARTVHVYGGAFSKAHVFAPAADGWYDPSLHALGYDA
jgi:predicted metal-dependent enzyme (double-stranded beta helix superfamily)